MSDILGLTIAWQRLKKQRYIHNCHIASTRHLAQQGIPPPNACHLRSEHNHAVHWLQPRRGEADVALLRRLQDRGPDMGPVRTLDLGALQSRPVVLFRLCYMQFGDYHKVQPSTGDSVVVAIGHMV